MRVFDQGVHGVGLKKDVLIEALLTINRWSPNAIKELLSLSSVPTHLVRPPSIHGSRHSHPYMVPGSMQQQLGACMQCGSIVYHRALSCMQAHGELSFCLTLDTEVRLPRDHFPFAIASHAPSAIASHTPPLP